jgi:riboflavin kinase / FMN adenylyltransferase
MDVVKGVRALNRQPFRSVVTIGNFDGVHRGHREIIGLAIRRARELSARSVVYTFRPHPRVALQPEKPFRLLSTYDEKIELMRGLGPDLLVEEPFSREFSTTPAEKFFVDVVIQGLGATAIVVGHDFGFGKSREGHLETLSRLCREARVDLTIVPPFKIGEEVVSSSRIRGLLDAGQLEEANRLLGYPFSYSVVVVKGDERGRKLGFPTCNLTIAPKLDLPFGVYATWTRLSSGVSLPSVTNIGVRPTFEKPSGVNELTREQPFRVETHIMGFSENLYGQSLNLQFIKKIREERKFPSVEDLITQIAKDVEVASRELAASSP